MPRRPDPSLLAVIAFSRHQAALEWAQNRLTQIYGPIVLASLPFPFSQTRYYESTMGANLQRIILLFSELADPAGLADCKVRTIALEKELADTKEFAEERPLNLDPGFLQLGKFLLATTKDQSHRIYLRDGIFAEVTLRFEAGHFHPWPWTYASYRELHVLAFFEEARELLHARLKAVRSTIGEQS